MVRGRESTLQGIRDTLAPFRLASGPHSNNLKQDPGRVLGLLARIQQVARLLCGRLPPASPLRSQSHASPRPRCGSRAKTRPDAGAVEAGQQKTAGCHKYKGKDHNALIPAGGRGLPRLVQSVVLMPRSHPQSMPPRPASESARFLLGSTAGPQPRRCGPAQH